MGRPSSSQPAVPRPLVVGERIELWRRRPATVEPVHTPPTAYEAIGHRAAGSGSGIEHDTEEWDVRPALVAALAGSVVALRAGTWPLVRSPVASPGPVPPAPAMIRRLTSEGIAEWDGHLAPPDAAAALLRSLDGDRARGTDRAASPRVGGNEQLLVFITNPRHASGRLRQRRRSPRVALRLTPVRLLPLPADAAPEHTLPPHFYQPNGDDTVAGAADQRGQQQNRLDWFQRNGDDTGVGQAVGAGDFGLGDPDLLPVARLTDVSLHGAGVVVDCPLPQGTPVRLEFDLPGEALPFVVRGRVVEPAVPLHGEAQPQVDGLPGFRRGIEFLGTQAAHEARRLRQVLALLRRRRSS